MKFLVAGAWHWPWYHQAFAQALTTLGHRVQGVGWAELFYKGLDTEQGATPRNLWTRVQHRVGQGPLVARWNRRLVEVCRDFQPDVLFAYNATLILPCALKRIKEVSPRTLLAQYANDNPFTPQAHWLLWRNLKRSIPLYDAHFVYRHSNERDLRLRGARNIHLLRSYFVPETDFRVSLTEKDQAFASDVVFVGHYEPDGRLENLETVARLGVNFKLFGGTWNLAERHLPATSPLRPLFPIRPLTRADYRKAISGTKIALCFLSKLNGDTYTRRTFEIPAMQTFMLSEFTEDLASLYEEGREAAFFRSPDELRDKVAYYLKHDSERQAIASNGYQRLLRDGHDILSRARQFVSAVERLGPQIGDPGWQPQQLSALDGPGGPNLPSPFPRKIGET